MKHLLLGSWVLPSGNTVEALLDIAAGDVPSYSARCEWQDFPPSEKDAEHYRQHIAPEVYRKCGEVLCPGGKVLGIQN